jgi:uncharacterized membrane-anchored protein
VFWSSLYLALHRIFQLIVLTGRGERANEMEIIALRHQVAVPPRQANRPDINDGIGCCWLRCRGCCLARRGATSS